MSKIKKFESWRAGQIAKVALLNGGFNHVYENPDNSSDFVAISGQTGHQQFFVDVKVSKRPKQTIEAYFKGKRSHKSAQPLMVVVVDSEKGQGVFKVKDSERESEMMPLRRDELEKVSKIK